MQQAKTLQVKLGAEGFQVIRRSRLKQLGLVLSTFRIPQSIPVNKALEALRRANPKVWLDANTRYKLQGTNNTIQRQTYGRKKIGWKDKHAKCAHNIRLGLIDSWVNIKHPAFKHASIRHKSFLTGGIVLANTDHGTAIASLLVGQNPKYHISGLLPGAKLYVAEVFRLRGKKTIDTTAEILVKAMNWLASQHVQVINLSLGGRRNLIMEAAIERALQRGIIIVAAAGNSGANGPPMYPAAQKQVVAVTALDAALRPYRNANRGPYIDFAAPGVDVWAAGSGNKGRYYSGTSYAAPFVSAVLAANQVVQNKTNPSHMIKNVRSRAQDLGKRGKDPIFGWGLVQAKGACGIVK